MSSALNLEVKRDCRIGVASSVSPFSATASSFNVETALMHAPAPRTTLGEGALKR